MEGEEIATCPSCSLMIKVVYDTVALEKLVSPTMLEVTCQ